MCLRPPRSTRTDTLVPYRTLCSSVGGIARVGQGEACCVDPAVQIFETADIARLERRAGGMLAKVDRARRGQHLPPADMVVEEQPEPQQPADRKSTRLNSSH